MKILNISCKNFKQFENAFFDFSNTSGLWSIHGPVGSGKTSIGELILFALFGRLGNVNNADLIRFGERKCTIDIDIESRRNVLHIHREISRNGSTLSASSNGEPIVFTSKRDAQQQLETEYFDVSRELIERLCIITLDGFNGITDMKKAERASFFNRIFGLVYITNFCDTLKEFIRDNNTEKGRAELLLKTLEEQKKRLLSLDADYDEKRLSDYTSRRTMVQRKLDDVKKEINDYKKTNTAMLQKMYDDIQQTKHDGKVVADRLAKLRNGVCPLCGASIHSHDIEEMEAERKRLLEQYNKQTVRYNENKTKYDSDVAEKEQQCNMLTKELSQLDTQIYGEKNKQKYKDDVDKQIGDIDRNIMSSKEVGDRCGVLETKYKELMELMSNNIKHGIVNQLIPKLNTTIAQYIKDFHQSYNIVFNESFDCIIHNNTINNEISINTLSTGQRRIVDTAVVLSLVDILMNNVNFNIFFLDELLSNIDYDNRDIVCKCIKRHLSPEQTLYIISHERMDDMNFDGAIRMTTKHNISEYQIFDY